MVTDHGRPLSLCRAATPTAQLAVGRGAGTRVPVRSIEVDDLSDGLSRAKARDPAITDGPADEPWGARRFCVTDPAGHLVNILGHAIAAR